MIATTGITTPMAIFSFVEKTDEIFSVTGVFVEPEDTFLGTRDGDVVEFTDAEEVSSVADTKVVEPGNDDTLAVVFEKSTTPGTLFMQLGKPIYLNWDIALDRKAVGSTVAGLVTEISGTILIEEPEVVTNDGRRFLENS